MYCPPCSRIVASEQAAARARPAPLQGQRVRHWYSCEATQPAQRRFGPAARRRCQVGWDQAAKTFRGAVIELRGSAEELTSWKADWTKASTIFAVEAPTIAALADELQRYAHLGPEVRRDVPPSLRDQVNPSAASAPSN